MEVHVDCGTCRWHLLRPRRMQLKQSGAASQIWSTVKSWAPSNFIRHFPLLSNAGFSGKVRPSKLHNCFICFSMSSRPFWFLRYPLASLAMSWFGWPAAWARLDGLSAAFFAAGFAGIFGCLRRGGSEAAISAAWPLAPRIMVGRTVQVSSPSTFSKAAALASVSLILTSPQLSEGRAPDKSSKQLHDQATDHGRHPSDKMAWPVLKSYFVSKTLCATLQNSVYKITCLELVSLHI